MTTIESPGPAPVTVSCLDALDRVRTVALYTAHHRRIVFTPPVAGGAAIFTAQQARDAGEALIALADHDDRLALAVGEPPSQPLRLVCAHSQA